MTWYVSCLVDKATRYFGSIGFVVIDMILKELMSEGIRRFDF